MKRYKFHKTGCNNNNFEGNSTDVKGNNNFEGKHHYEDSDPFGNYDEYEEIECADFEEEVDRRPCFHELHKVQSEALQELLESVSSDGDNSDDDDDQHQPRRGPPPLTKMPNLVLQGILNSNEMSDMDMTFCVQPNEAYVNGLSKFGIEASALPNLAVMGAKPPGISSMLDPASCTH